jgi:replicative DNA helicase
MRARAKRRKLKSGLDLIIVDQLSFIKYSAERKHEGYGQVTTGLKCLAKELGVPVVLLHQLNRDTAKEGRRPQLHDLKDSGSVEEDADVVILIHRPGYYNDQINQTETELIIAKNRMGARETVRCGWRGESASFCNQPYDDGSGKPLTSDADYKPMSRRRSLS